MDYERILVFGAHPDDEVVMAATMAKLSAGGCEVHVGILTDGREGYAHPSLRETIVEIRRGEQAECDRVLGVAKRHNLNAPDQGLANSKESFRWLVGLIREVRPDAIFTHGPHTRHRDHRATHELTVEARWQAGEPVNSDLGPSHRTPHLYYDKEVTPGLPEIAFDVTGFLHKRLEALATQASQMAVFGRKVEDLRKEAAEDEAHPAPAHDRFWIAPRNRLQGFLPKGL